MVPMRYFTSDLHLGHQNIIEYCGRPFSSVEEMNDALIYNWNSVIADDDEVYILGDLAMGVLRNTVALAAELRGTKFLIPGNHDACHPMHKKHKKMRKLYEDAGLEILSPQYKMHIGDTSVLLCHFPYFGDSDPNRDRYSGLRPDRLGNWLLCGHVHDAWTVKDKMINVGVDVWDFRPVPEIWIEEIII